MDKNAHFLKQWHALGRWCKFNKQFKPNDLGGSEPTCTIDDKICSSSSLSRLILSQAGCRRCKGAPAHDVLWPWVTQINGLKATWKSQSSWPPHELAHLPIHYCPSELTAASVAGCCYQGVNWLNGFSVVLNSQQVDPRWLQENLSLKLYVYFPFGSIGKWCTYL